jgi:hypothetical protein
MVAASHRIIESVLGGKHRRLTPELARETLRWKFSERDRQRASLLLEKNSANDATPDERSELFALVALGSLLDVLHARAKVVLEKQKSRIP